MLVMHAHAGWGLAAHGIHYAVVGGGVLGLVALLSPRFLSAPTAPRDEHEARVLALRAALTQPGPAPSGPAPSGPAPSGPAPSGPAPSGPSPIGHRLPGLAAGTLSATALDPIQVATHDGWLSREPALTAAQRALLPLAVVSSTAAAGVHAAVGPEHLRESALFGAFFAGSALLQLIWSAWASVRGSAPLLVAGAVGNLAIIGLWATTRTLGLPFGLLPHPEPVGPWDLACAAWELVVVCCCIGMLRSRDPLPTRLGDWRGWHPGLPTYVVASALLLLALSASGAGA